LSGIKEDESFIRPLKIDFPSHNNLMGLETSCEPLKEEMALNTELGPFGLFGVGDNNGLSEQPVGVIGRAITGPIETLETN
jgi:hypothetical protein